MVEDDASLVSLPRGEPRSGNSSVDQAMFPFAEKVTDALWGGCFLDGTLSATSAAMCSDQPGRDIGQASRRKTQADAIICFVAPSRSLTVRFLA
jgi:hypothetical protein